MRYLWSLAVVVALTGCASADPVIESSPTPVAVSTEPSTPRPTPEPSPTPTAEPTPDGPPKQCLDYKSSDSMTDKTMTKAAAKADLPPTVVLMHAQTIHSTDEPGTTDVVVRICSEPLTGASHREIATAVATAVYDADLDAKITRFYVTSWIPVGDSIEQGDPLRIDDFALYLWGPDVPDPDSRWKTRMED